MRARGFTLVEMLIVVAVGAILVTVALPGYQDYLRKARRADGQEALLRLQLEQERFRANRVSYATTLGAGDTGLGLPGAIGDLRASAEAHYTLSVVSASATGYVLQADGNGSLSSGRQAKDGACTVLQLTLSPSGEQRAPTACW